MTRKYNWLSTHAFSCYYPMLRGGDKNANVEMMGERFAVDPYDVCEGLEKIPVYFENREVIQTEKDFKYVKFNIAHSDTDMDDFDTKLLGCDCRPSCSGACPCMSRFGPNYSPDGNILPHLLASAAVKPMVECNSQCSCSSQCSNRLVQFGINANLQVFRSSTKGFGLRTLEGIPRLSFICEYAGEVLSQTEAHARLSSLKPQDMNYLFVLKEHCSSGVLNMYVDPKFVGNIGRYLNHSCDPNLTMVPVRVNNNIPKLALFANRDIPSNQELCYDYGGQAQKETKFSDQTRKPCLCGENICKGYLPYEPEIFT